MRNRLSIAMWRLLGQLVMQLPLRELTESSPRTSRQELALPKTRQGPGLMTPLVPLPKAMRQKVLPTLKTMHRSSELKRAPYPLRWKFLVKPLPT